MNVLFLCTGNSARSILAEALLNDRGRGHFTAFSAGSHPAGQVNPLALETLRRHGVPVGAPRSKSWDEFAQTGSPRMDLIITVCDQAAGEICPIWPGHPATVHWGIPDPAAVTGTADERLQAFEAAFRSLDALIRPMTAADPKTLDAQTLTALYRSSSP